MNTYDYVIAGASHAALEAVRAIRSNDTSGTLALLNRETGLPYSPTVLPYVVSGFKAPEDVALRDEAWLKRMGADYLGGAALASLDTHAKMVALADGRRIGYGKLLLATGAVPAIPSIPGLPESGFHVLRTLADACALRERSASVRRAVVIGAGLVGMHAAENLSHAGVEVTLLEQGDQVLPGYFDPVAASLIRDTFTNNGIAVRTSTPLRRVEKVNETYRLELDKGAALETDLLVVAAGVRPSTEYLTGSPVAVDRGICVDGHMRTNVADVWAAGDVVRTPSFYGEGIPAGGILPDAVEQGRIAGQSMSGDAGITTYPGGVPLNTYGFFGHRALSVGRDIPKVDVMGWKSHCRHDTASGRYLKIVVRDNLLQGIFSVDVLFDPGIMWELILRGTDLSPLLDRMLADPIEAARILMSRNWR